MNKFRWLLPLAVFALALSGCGGSNDKAFVGSGSGGSSSSSSSVTVASVTVSSNSASIPADNSASATITALVRDANNVALQGVTVSFAASAGALAVTQATTDATGTATATLTASGAAANSQITVTATVGTVSGKATIAVASNQQTVSLLTSSPQMPSDGSQPATITAVVRNASNQLVPGVAVSFQSDSGGISPGTVTTDSNGSAAATLITAGDETNRTITVTAAAGSSSAKISVDVIGTKVTVTGPTSLVQNSQGTYNVSLTDSGGKGIGGRTIAVASKLGNPLGASSLTTDGTGHATFTMTASTSGTDTLTASALGLTASQSVAISNQSFAFTTPAPSQTTPSVPLGQALNLAVTWTASGAAQANQPVSFSTTRGDFTGNTPTVNVTTNASGVAATTISSTTAGPATITATGAGVTAQLAVDFIATTPASMAVQASPATIPTQGQSTISAIVRDAQNNLVQNQVVTFQLSDTTGGTLSVGNATTDAQGLAQTVYTASSTPSASNGVTVTASIPSAPSVPAQQVSLTVGGQTVFLSLGTGNTIQENASKTQFIVPYVVQAMDASGHAVAGVAITLTVHSMPVATGLNAYAKGEWVSNGKAWVQTDGTGTIGNLPTECKNEDVNLNGILDSGEDFNSNGKLDPGDVGAVSPGTVTTDSTGAASFNVSYPESYAMWVQVQLTASTSVQGTQSSTSVNFWLPQLAAYVNNIQQAIPGNPSPFGIATDCTNKN